MHSKYYLYANAYTSDYVLSYYVVMRDVKDAVAERILQLCKQRKISLNELAHLSGLTPSTVYSLIDPSRRKVGLHTVKNVCAGFGMSLKDFFNDDIFCHEKLL